jgi:hypothetical protein
MIRTKADMNMKTQQNPMHSSAASIGNWPSFEWEMKQWQTEAETTLPMLTYIDR